MVYAGLNRRAHEESRYESGILLTAGVLLLSGCEENDETSTGSSAGRNTRRRPAVLRARCRFPSRPLNPVFLSRDIRPEIDILIEEVQAKLKTGQEEYQAGDIDKARADFDAALDEILASGFPSDFDPRLSKLFDQTGEAINSYEVTAAETRNAEAAQDSVPSAPIDEIADLTLPAADPRLALKAQKELISAPHDLPLMVNESVLQYLSFFTTTQGPRHRRARAAARRALQRHDSPGLKRRRAFRRT